MPTLGLVWYESLTCERAIADPGRAFDAARPAWPWRIVPLHHLKPTSVAEPLSTPLNPAREHRV